MTATVHQTFLFPGHELSKNQTLSTLLSNMWFSLEDRYLVNKTLVFAETFGGLQLSLDLSIAKYSGQNTLFRFGFIALQQVKVKRL